MCFYGGAFRQVLESILRKDCSGGPGTFSQSSLWVCKETLALPKNRGGPFAVRKLRMRFFERGDVGETKSERR